MASPTRSVSTSVDPDDVDIDLVVHWTRADIPRWVAGALAGVLAAMIALAFASVFSAAVGKEFWFAAKLMATPFLGASATAYGVHLLAISVGTLFFLALGSVLGFAFAHFVFTNHVPSLLAMGMVWAAFSWVFIWNLFFQSIRPLHFMAVPPSAAIPVCVVFGISLVSVGFFDRIVRRGK